MFRASLAKALAASNGKLPITISIRATASTPAKAPEKIEVFVDDKSVWVEPGTTVLQVNFYCVEIDLKSSINFCFEKNVGCCISWC